MLQNMLSLSFSYLMVPPSGKYWHMYPDLKLFKNFPAQEIPIFLAQINRQ